MQLDDNQGLDSSADLDLDVEANDASLENGASSSDAQNSEAPERDTLSIVRDVVEGEKSQGELASQATGEETGEQPGDSEPKSDAENEDYSDVPFHKHPRFKQLLRERDNLKPDATRYRNVQNFLDQNGVSAEEGAEALLVAGLLKTNPVEAWNRIKPIVQQLIVAAGEALPSELQAAVQNGEISHERALELSRTKAALQAQEHQKSFQEQQATLRQQQDMAQAIQQTAADWERDRRIKDPNFDAKQGPLMREIAFLQMQEGKPTTPQGVLDQLRRAYAAVTPVSTAAPAQRPKTNARPSTSGQVSSAAQPTPQSTLDIIKMEMAKRS